MDSRTPSTRRTASDVAGPLPVWSGLLTPQGKCLFDFMVWLDSDSSGDDLLLDCEESAADELIKRLSIYRLRRPIRIERDDVVQREAFDGLDVCSGTGGAVRQTRSPGN